MPELPEVETIRQALLPRLKGRAFSQVAVLDPTLVRPTPEEFCRLVTGRRVQDIGRRGKFLFFDLSDSAWLIFHLRMTGSLLFHPEPGMRLRAQFTMDDGAFFFFADRRRLGVAWVGDRCEIEARLGPEPLEPSFTAGLLGRLLANRSAPIKALLLDQSLIAGLGNIYADEVLFAARIHPLRQGKSLGLEEVKGLHKAIQEVLKKALEHRGTTFSDYRTPDGGRGNQLTYLAVAHRGGQPCPRCGTPIQRLPLRNRGSYFCPCCQHG